MRTLVTLNYQTAEHHCPEFKWDIENETRNRLTALENSCISKGNLKPVDIKKSHVSPPPPFGPFLALNTLADAPPHW